MNTDHQQWINMMQKFLQRVLRKSHHHQNHSFIFTSSALILTTLFGCGPSSKDLAALNYIPLAGDDWEVSSPEAEGLDADTVAELYYDSAKLNSIYSLLIVKNSYLVAEKYFNDGSIYLKSNLQSVGKSFTSALVGIAFEQGCLPSLDQPFLAYFPEYVNLIKDPRKQEITIRHLLQMRSGYPWEESDRDLWEVFVAGDFLGLMVHVPLINDPGTEFHYSNLSSHYLGVIVDRACGTDLRTFAEEQLFTPLGAELGEWYTTASDDRYPMGTGTMHMTARDAAKFGLLYLNDGIFDGKQVISSEWVHDSLQNYTQNPSVGWPKEGRNVNRTGYGYQWWAIQSGEHHYHAALGHGGQVIAVLDKFNMVIVVTGDPFFLEHNAKAWKSEKQLINLVADFIASLPSE
ncbi:class C beta-lactamase-related serine hydrolase [Leptolyngbyaceae cyanobacterium CCMR0082]|uniref:Class C beta-lactamase-related serine hydrolase n=1 Tax=Adonisia turfae CCMR0082 TaxID=2304604 RepID=A0A6M0SFP2_9CYAN|nr:serine hydrolase [Adonisia turfae]NEZ66813.1 class C beta-lactamase-related serine hydrolase [Adonisia turfae CCMR0082]